MKTIRTSAMRRVQLDQLLAIADHEIRAGLRGRMIPAFALFFAALTIGVTLAGLGASGRVLVQEFPRTSISVLTLAVYVLPLMALIIGASAIGGEGGGSELLLAQPITRTTAILGRVLGLTFCVLAVALAGFGSAGVLVFVGAGGSGIGAYLLVAASTTVLALASLNLGVLVGIAVRRRTTAVGWALAVWFVAAVLFDVGAILLLQTVGNGDPGPSLVVLLSLNPIDAVRVLGTIALGADVLLGPTGTAAERMLGVNVWVLLSAVLIAWVVLPLAAAARMFRQRDF
jgi:Cu-processing system permease protein